MNVGKFEDLVNECVEWKLDIIGVSETHMRGMTELSDREQKYKFVGKGRCEQSRKGGGVGVMIQTDAQMEIEVLNVGNCSMSEDILAVRLERRSDNGNKCESMHICVCYMTVEGPNARDENRRKYEILKNFVNEYGNEEIIIMGDMNGHIGVLGERMNGNRELLREFCDETQFEILNETVAEGRVTWQRREVQSAIDYVLTNARARERVCNMCIDEEGGFNIDTDHNLLYVMYESRLRERRIHKVRKKKKWCLNNVDWSRFQMDLSQMADVEDGDVDSMNDALVGKVSEVAKKRITHTSGRVHKGKYNPWWNREIRVERQERKRLNKECRKMRKRMENDERRVEDYMQIWDDYKVQKNKVKQLIRNAKTEYEKKKVDELRKKVEKNGIDT